LPGGDIGSALSVQVMTQSQGVWIIYTVLSESLADIGRIKAATTDLTNARLEEHEAQLRKEAESRSGPKL